MSKHFEIVREYEPPVPTVCDRCGKKSGVIRVCRLAGSAKLHEYCPVCAYQQRKAYGGDQEGARP